MKDIIEISQNYGINALIAILIVIIGRSSDKYVKRTSKILFAGWFLRMQLNCLRASEISLNVLDSVFKFNRSYSKTIPDLKRLYLVSVVSAGSLLVFYLFKSMDNYQFVYTESDSIFNSIRVSMLVFYNESIDDSMLIEFTFVALLPLIIFIANPILDLISFAETRYLLVNLIKTLKNNENSNIALKIAVFCIADFILSYLLFLIFISGARWDYMHQIAQLQLPGNFSPNLNIFDELKSFFTGPFYLIDSYIFGSAVSGLFGGILISTFISTLFIWLVFFAYLLSSLQRYLKRPLVFITHHTHIIRVFYRKPFSIISYIFSLTILCLTF